MGEKLYRPILEEGDHLVKSKETEGRVRGVSQDTNNRTTNIIEWEEVEVEDEISQQEEPDSAQMDIEGIIALAVTGAIIYGAGKLNKYVVQPWWKNNAQPWLNDKMSDAKQFFLKRRGHSKTEIKSAVESLYQNQKSVDIESGVLSMDELFDSIKFDMSTEEAEKHVLNLIYHMLGVANEIKILSNSIILEQFEDENARLEYQKNAERILVNKVVCNINRLLSDDKLQLNEAVSKRLFELLGGGIRVNEEYIPVQVNKVEEAMKQYRHKPE